MNIRWLQGAAALAVLTAGSGAFAADHLDGPGAQKDPAADITDVYGWVKGDKLILVLNVSPLATVDSKFSAAIQYALHVESSAGFGKAGTKTDVIATFDASQKISVWVGADEYVSGDASGDAGITSKSGGVKVYAGLRADPFYFNLEGFQDTVKTVVSVAGMLTFDPAGCPAIDMATSGVLVGQLQGTAKGTKPAANFFATANVLGIVLEIDKALVTGGGTTLAVWGSTHKAGG